MRNIEMRTQNNEQRENVPSDLDTFIQGGVELMRTHRYPDAIEYFRDALGVFHC